MANYPTDKDTKKLMKRLENDLGWIWDEGGSHTAGALYCPAEKGDRCRIPVFKTPKGPAGGQARALIKLCRKCRHGFSPNRG